MKYAIHIIGLLFFQWSFATDIYTVVDCVITISQLLCGDD